MGPGFGDSDLPFCLARRIELGARGSFGFAALPLLRVHVSFGMVLVPEHSTGKLFDLACASCCGGNCESFVDCTGQSLGACVVRDFRVFSGLDQQMSRQYPLLFGSGVFLYLLAVALYYILLSNAATHEAEKREVEARLLARDSELKALKTQVNPHFIFNCLNSISALTSSDPATAREMCIRLAEFLRKTLGLGEKSSIPLREELELVHAYVSVEQIRFGARLKFEEDTDPGALEQEIPPLLLQPLIENAIRHGIATLAEGGRIRLEIKNRDSGNLAIDIENNFDPEAPRRVGANIGLKNVRQRVDATYGNRSRFDVSSETGRFHVAIQLPAVRPA